MHPFRSFLLLCLLFTVAHPLLSQSIQFPVSTVTVAETRSGMTFHGLESPVGTLPDLILKATIPAIDANSAIVIGGVLKDRPIAQPTVRSFVGHIDGQPESNVAITYVGATIFGLIQEEDGTTWVMTRDMEKQIYSIASGNQAFSLPDCGFRDEGVMPEIKGATQKLSATGLRELELAVETDTEFFKNTGGDEQKAATYLAALMSSVSSLYQKELGVVIKVVWARIWTNAPADPYNVAGNPFALSDAVKTNWSKYDTVRRDLFHAITASAGGGGGYAFADAICRTESHAHGATSVQGWTDLSAPGFNYDIYIVSHEIGHNFNAQHTHSCYYGFPLDTCEVDEAIQQGCLSPNQEKLPNPGSIMSYCGWTNLNAGNGYTVEMSFKEIVKTGMKEYAQTLECLSEVVLPIPIPNSPAGDTLTTGMVTLSWTETWTQSYEIELQGDSSLVATSLSESLNLTLEDGEYQWRVRSATVGATSDWSDWTSFVVKQKSALPAVLIVEPDGDTLLTGIITLKWSSPWSGNFNLEMRGDKTVNENSAATSHMVNLSEGEYEWRVRAVDGTSGGEWSKWASVVVRDQITGVESANHYSKVMDLW